MGRLFGTDGVRGIANKELTAELAFKLGRVGAYVLAEGGNKPRILVGTDTRLSSDMLESSLISGICSVGAKALTCGVIPTPAIAALIKKYRCDAGVVISASHNPYEYNGIKFFSSDGCKLPDEIEDKIEDIMLSDSSQIPSPVGNELGIKINCPNAIRDYIEIIKGTLSIRLDGLKVALDCANGACSFAGPLLLKELGVELTVINNSPDGTNINNNCGSTHMDGLINLVKENDYDIGIAFDGDADRVLACDEKGEVIDGDKILAILAGRLTKEGRLAQNTIVATVMSNLGLDVFARENGINIVKTDVGDRYVLEEMMKNGYTLGGEQSGHVILLDYNTTGDGLLTAVQLLQVLKMSGEKASQLASAMKVFPQVLRNAKVSNDKKNKYLEDLEIAKMCRNIEGEFRGEGRVLIRPSGTEPLVRVMIEGKDQKYIASKAEELATLIEARLGIKN